MPLLDQRIACGVGNVFKSEVCFACGVDPATPVGAPRRRPSAPTLVATAARLLRANLGPGPRTTVPVGPGALAVYGRAGRPCRRCGTRIRVQRTGRARPGHLLVPDLPAAARRTGFEVGAGPVHDGSMGTRPHVVIVGAGFGGLTAAKRLEREAVDVTLVDRHNYHSFQPLLYQVATAGLNAADVGYAVRGLFRRQQRVLFRKAQVTGVDWDARQLVLRDEPPLAFDHLILAAGSSTNYFGVPGAAEFAFPLYGLEDAVRVRNHLLSLFEAAEAVPGLVDDGVSNLVIVGGGPTGVEVAGAMAELVDKVLRQDFHDLDVRRARGSC